MCCGWIHPRDLQGQLHKEDVDASGKPARSNWLEAQLIAHTLLQIDKQCASPAIQQKR